MKTCSTLAVLFTALALLTPSPSSAAGEPTFLLKCDLPKTVLLNPDSYLDRVWLYPEPTAISLDHSGGTWVTDYTFVSIENGEPQVDPGHVSHYGADGSLLSQWSYG